MSARRARSTRDKARPPSPLQRALYRAAKASPTRRFHALIDKMYREDVLPKACREVKTNAGSAGVDEQTIEQIEQYGVEVFLAELRTELSGGHYRPRAVRRAWIPKPDGSQRGLGIPTVSAYNRGTPAVFGFTGCHPPVPPIARAGIGRVIRAQVGWRPPVCV